MIDDPKPPSGSYNEPGATLSMEGPASINEPGASVTAPPVEPHSVDDIDPAGAALGDPDVELHVFGTNFREGAEIMFNGGIEPTEYISETELSTIVKPSTATTVGEFPVTVLQDGLAAEPPIMFEFVDNIPVSRKTASKRRR